MKRRLSIRVYASHTLEARTRPCARRKPWASFAAVSRGVLTVLAVVSALFASTVWGKTWSVPSPEAPTIMAALDRAVDRDRIRVAPGTYVEQLVLDKSVTLEPQQRTGSGAESTHPVIIDGGGMGRVLSIKAPGTVVVGLTVRGSGDVIGKSDACIYVHGEAAGTRLTGNTLTDCAFGIWVHGTSDVTIEDNIISGRPRPIFSDRGNGINLWQVKRNVIRRNRITGTRDGVYLSVTSDSLIEDNRMQDLRFGIHYMYSDNNKVIGNVTRDSLVGIALMFSRGLKIIGNRVENNRDRGIFFRTIYDSTIRGNIAIGNKKGFFLNDAGFNVLEGNHVEGNDIGVHITGGSEENRITGNTFMRNRVQVRFAWLTPQYWDGMAEEGNGEKGPESTVTIRGGNYWSDYLGWDMNGDGVGDRPHYTAGTMDRLIFRYPSMKVLATSPVVLLLQALESRFPVLRPPGVIDRRPLLSPPTPMTPSPQEESVHMPVLNLGEKS